MLNTRSATLDPGWMLTDRWILMDPVQGFTVVDRLLRGASAYSEGCGLPAPAIELDSHVAGQGFRPQWQNASAPHKSIDVLLRAHKHSCCSPFTLRRIDKSCARI
nr:hypothetical protein CFP56_63365 [Quercus suber]POE94791.1 hypothetical protein CFP56_17028 [Quercus suber]